MMDRVIETISFRPTVCELAEARTVLQLSGPTPTGIKRGILGWILFLGLAVMLFFLLRTEIGAAWRNVGETGRRDVYIGCSVMVAGALCVVLAFIVLRRARHLVLRPVRFVLTEDELQEHSSDQSLYWRWDAFTSLAETQNLFVLRHRPDLGRFIPKQAFSTPADVEGARQFLQRKLPIGVVSDETAIPARG